MTYELKAFDEEEHYAHLLLWWDERNYPATEPRFLAPTGRVVTYGEVPVCAGFLYRTDGNFASIGHLVSDPNIERDVRFIAMDVLIDSLVSEAKASGFPLITAATNLEHLNKRYERLGFRRYDSGITHLGRSL